MWIIAGLVIIVVVPPLVVWLRNNKIQTRWYDWVIGLGGLVLLLFAIQNYYGSQTGGEPTAGNVFMLVVTGLPGLILMGVAWQLISRRACRNHNKLC